MNKPLRPPNKKFKLDGKPTQNLLKFQEKFRVYEATTTEAPDGFLDRPITPPAADEVVFTSDAYGTCDACSYRTLPGQSLTWVPTIAIRHSHCPRTPSYVAIIQAVTEAARKAARKREISYALQVLMSLTNEERAELGLKPRLKA